MRHQTAGRKLGRKSAHRNAMFRNMVSSLIEHGKIKTTLHKAKELRGVAERMVTLGKKNTLHARRQAFDYMRSKDAVKKLFDEIAPAFEKRAGGYTRILKLGHRAGDAAKMALIEFLSEDLLSARVEGKVLDKPKKKVEKKAKSDSEAKAKPATEEKAEKKAAAKKASATSKPKKAATSAKKAASTTAKKTTAKKASTAKKAKTEK